MSCFVLSSFAPSCNGSSEWMDRLSLYSLSRRRKSSIVSCGAGCLLKVAILYSTSMASSSRPLASRNLGLSRGDCLAPGSRMTISISVVARKKRNQTHDS